MAKSLSNRGLLSDTRSVGDREDCTLVEKKNLLRPTQRELLYGKTLVVRRLKSVLVLGHSNEIRLPSSCASYRQIAGNIFEHIRR